ncbi:MAG: substrate-binding domain-containing protein [Polyangiaceae bacterium]|nr:substrate-binding domain-containing protein [Polyangiaceae bacterium]
MLIGLCIDNRRGYENGLLLGIAAYARPHKPWIFEAVWPPLEGLAALIAKKPSGILLRTRDPLALKLVVGSGISAVNIDNLTPPMGMGQVCNDNVKVGELAAEHFLNRGHTRFAYSGHPTDFEDPRHLGFSSRLKKAGFSCAAKWANLIAGSPTSIEANYRELVEWLVQLPKPVALLCDGDARASGVVERCREWGLRVPEEVAVLGIDNTDSLCCLADPPLSSVQTAAQSVGYEAAHLLDQLMRGEAPASLSIKVPPVRVVSRRSTDAVSAPDPLVQEALRYMKTHLVDKEGLEAVSQHFKVSRRTLERRFRECLGLAPAEAWVRFRVEEAQRLLADTDQNMATVAKRCGFHLSKRMAEVFRRTTGRTPREHRQLARPEVG